MNPEPARLSFPALGTTAVVLTTEPGALEPAAAAVRLEIAGIDGACSRFRPDSELSLLNGAGGRPTRVSPLFLEALGVALRAARLTAGRVDPTVGTALRLVGYDRNFGDVDPSGPPLAVQATAVPGWRAIEIDREGSTVRVPAGVEVDLGATAKALCADRAARLAADASRGGVLVSLGGDIAVAGPPPPGGWRVRVTDDHAAPRGAPGQTVVIAGGGLATSGTSVRRWERGGQILHHLIDPATGQPAPSCWRTVSVAAGSCVDANIASTAAVILGPDAPPWLAGQRLPARLVAADGRVVVVGGWPAEGDDSDHSDDRDHLGQPCSP